MVKNYNDNIVMIHVANYVLGELKYENGFNKEEQEIINDYLNYYKAEIAAVKNILPQLDMDDMSYNDKVKCIIKTIYEIKGKTINDNGSSKSIL